MEYPMNLYEDKDVFLELVQTTSQHFGLPEVFVEKDYWVTKALKHLSESEVSKFLVFKGGTSLSKAHKIIHRFSEDIDLAVIANGLGDAKRKQLLKTTEALAATGLELVSEDERISKGSKFRKTVYRYPRDLDAQNFGQASPELLIEVNAFTTPEPSERKQIQSMVADFLTEQAREDLVEQYGLMPFGLNVLSVERTLIEKLLGIIKDSYSEDPIARLSDRIRHVYDVCMIVRDSSLRGYIATDEFENLCDKCIADEKESWDEEQTKCLDVPLAEAPLFDRFDEFLPGLEKVYKGDFADLVYGELPGIDEIRETLAFLKERLRLK
jgi:hypothetical protein